MYLDKSTVDDFFASLPKRGVKLIVIIDEGTPKEDIIREDNTTMYNFKKRLEVAGYSDKTFIEIMMENDINKHYKYFVMY